MLVTGRHRHRHSEAGDSELCGVTKRVGLKGSRRLCWDFEALQF